MPIGKPIPPIQPVPSPVGRAQAEARVRNAGPRRNPFEAFARYLRYRMIMERRGRRPFRPPTGAGTREERRGDPKGIDTRA
jgi:hypothetical protein